MGYTLFPAATSEPAKNGFFENMSNGTQGVVYVIMA
jgi:hypothetical protein